MYQTSGLEGQNTHGGNFTPNPGNIVTVYNLPQLIFNTEFSFLLSLMDRAGCSVAYAKPSMAIHLPDKNRFQREHGPVTLRKNSKCGTDI